VLATKTIVHFAILLMVKRFVLFGITLVAAAGALGAPVRANRNGVIRLHSSDNYRSENLAEQPSVEDVERDSSKQGIAHRKGEKKTRKLIDLLAVTPVASEGHQCDNARQLRSPAPEGDSLSMGHAHDPTSSHATKVQRRLRLAMLTRQAELAKLRENKGSLQSNDKPAPEGTSLSNGLTSSVPRRRRRTGSQSIYLAQDLKGTPLSEGHAPKRRRAGNQSIYRGALKQKFLPKSSDVKQSDNAPQLQSLAPQIVEGTSLSKGHAQPIDIPSPRESNSPVSNVSHGQETQTIHPLAHSSPVSIDQHTIDVSQTVVDPPAKPNLLPDLNLPSTESQDQGSPH